MQELFDRVASSLWAWSTLRVMIALTIGLTA